MVTKQEFFEWRNQPLTQEWLIVANDLANDAVAKIVNRPDVNPGLDQYLKGLISGLSEIIGWQPEFLPESVEESILGESVEVDDAA